MSTESVTGEAELVGGGAWRLRVPDGWLVFYAAAVCFVPDPDGAWVLAEPECA